MVTVYYIRRYLNFLDQLFCEASGDAFALSGQVADFLKKTTATLGDEATDYDTFVALQHVGEEHRKEVYRRMPTQHVEVPVAEIREFIAMAF